MKHPNQQKGRRRMKLDRDASMAGTQRGSDAIEADGEHEERAKSARDPEEGRPGHQPTEGTSQGKGKGKGTPVAARALHVAMRHAPDGRKRYVPGSGCGNRMCVRSRGTFQPGRYVPRQLNTIDGILSGGAFIIAQPRTYSDGKRMWAGRADSLKERAYLPSNA